MEGITEDIKVDTMEDTMEDIMEDTMEDIIIVVDIMAAMVDIKYFYESIKISWDLVLVLFTHFLFIMIRTLVTLIWLGLILNIWLSVII